MNMSSRLRVSVVIPVHDERETLAELHQRLTDALRGEGWTYELLFVDDGSTDGSTDALRALARNDPAACVVVLARRFGPEFAVLSPAEFCQRVLVDGLCAAQVVVGDDFTFNE